MEDDSIYAACPIRSQLTDFGEILQHTWVNCNICCRLKQKAESQKAAASNVKSPDPVIKIEPATNSHPKTSPNKALNVTSVKSYDKPVGRKRIGKPFIFPIIS
jgi:hypothetical protein